MIRVALVDDQQLVRAGFAMVIGSQPYLQVVAEASDGVQALQVLSTTQADVVLMNDRLENFLAAYELSRRARTIIRQNVAISLGVIVVLVGCALLGKIPLTIGVLGHEGSTVVVVLNSLRLLLADRRDAQKR